MLASFVDAENAVLIFKNRAEFDEFRYLPKVSSSHNNHTSVIAVNRLVVVALKKTICPASVRKYEERM